jgi:acyl-coenzyme A thioesterase PaaI-like protein
MTQKNALSRAVGVFAPLPSPLRWWLVTKAFASQVKFVGTASIRFELLEEGRSVLHLKNRRKVQNHIRGIHASAMALLAETATGAVVGMSLPDSKLPLFKSMHVDYVKRATGDLRAEATLSPEQIRRLQAEEKGDLIVPVKITDSAGIEPVVCQMCWAWVPKKK